MSKTRTAQLNDNLGVVDTLLDKLVLVENFNQRPALNADILITSTNPTLAQMALRFAANRDFEVLGTNMTTALCTHSTGGGITLTTAGAENDQAILSVHLDATQTTWATTDFSTDDEIALATRLKTGASIAAATIWFGWKLTNTPVVATDANQAFFRYEPSTNSGKFQAVYSVSGTDYELDTGVTVAAATEYVLEISVDDDRVPRFFINGKLVATGTALTTGIDLLPYAGVQAGAAAAKAITVRKICVAKTTND